MLSDPGSVFQYPTSTALNGADYIKTQECWLAMKWNGVSFVPRVHGQPRHTASGRTELPTGVLAASLFSPSLGEDCRRLGGTISAQAEADISSALPEPSEERSRPFGGFGLPLARAVPPGAAQTAAALPQPGSAAQPRPEASAPPLRHPARSPGLRCAWLSALRPPAFGPRAGPPSQGTAAGAGRVSPPGTGHGGAGRRRERGPPPAPHDAAPPSCRPAEKRELGAGQRKRPALAAAAAPAPAPAPAPPSAPSLRAGPGRERRGPWPRCGRRCCWAARWPPPAPSTWTPSGRPCTRAPRAATSASPWTSSLPTPPRKCAAPRSVGPAAGLERIFARLRRPAAVLSALARVATSPLR